MKIYSFFSSLFKKNDPGFNIIDCSSNEIPQIKLDQIRKREIDCLIVRNFIDEDERNSLIKSFAKETSEIDTLANPIYPNSFAQIDRDSKNFLEEIKEYFVKSEAFNDQFEKNFNVDIIQKLKNLIQQMDNNSNLNPTPGIDNKGLYLPGTFRVQHPEKVNINLHCGNQFIELFPKYYEHLSQNVDIMDQLSYFTMLQQAEEGGRLIIYGISWAEAKECDTVNNTITSKTGKEFNLNSTNKIHSTKLQINNGDLLIFSGGQIWHAVEQVKGNQKRITYGGFIGFGKSSSEDLYCWS